MIEADQVGIVFKCSPTVSYLHFESALRVFSIVDTPTRKKEILELSTTFTKNFTFEAYKHQAPKRQGKRPHWWLGWARAATLIIGGNRAGAPIWK